MAPGARPSRAASFWGRLSSGSPSSRRILATLIDMDGRLDLVAYRGSGPKQIRVMSSTWLCPEENSRISWISALPTASGPPGVSASFLINRRLSRESYKFFA